MAKSAARAKEPTKIFGITLGKPASKKTTEPETETETEAAAPPPTGRDDGLARIAVGLSSASLVLLAALFFFLIETVLPRQDLQRMEEVAEQTADHYAALLGAQLQFMRQRLAAVTETADVGSAFANYRQFGDVSLLKTIEGRMAPAFPEGQSLQLIPLTDIGMGDLTNLRLNALSPLQADVVRRAAAEKGASMEALRIDGRWQAVFGHWNPTNGVVLLNVDGSHFTDLAKKAAGGKVQVQIQQVIDSRRTSFATAAIASPSELTISRKLKGTNWEVAVTLPESALKAHAVDPVWLWALCGLAMACNLITALFISVSTGRLIHKDLATMVMLGNDFKLKGFKSARDRMVERFKAASRQRKMDHQDEIDAPQEPAVDDTPHHSPQQLAAAMAIEEVAHSEPKPAALPELESISPDIFRAYDIRGDADLFLSDAICIHIGAAIGTTVAQLEGGSGHILTSRDGRQSSPRIAHALTRGLLSTGIKVTDLGVLPTPAMYFACHHLNIPNGVQITGSHNPGSHNGMKMVLGGKVVASSDIQGLLQRVEAKDYTTGKGEADTAAITEDYLQEICGRVSISKPIKVVVDAANGAAGTLAPELFRQLGCEVVELFCDIDGRFPNHPPDPTVDEHLHDLVEMVKTEKADLGIALDGDADRVVAVTGSGRILRSDQLLLVLAKPILDKNPGGGILYDVKCSMHCRPLINEWGGKPLVGRCGHAPMKIRMAESEALLGAELSGHIFFNDNWFGFDDGMYVAARLMEQLADSDRNLDDWLDTLPKSVATNEILLPASDKTKFTIVRDFMQLADFGDAEVLTLDGVRVETADAWGLIRASNTGPALTLRFEGKDAKSLVDMQQQFCQQLEKVDKRLATLLAKAT